MPKARFLRTPRQAEAGPHSRFVAGEVYDLTERQFERWQRRGAVEVVAEATIENDRGEALRLHKLTNLVQITEDQLSDPAELKAAITTPVAAPLQPRRSNPNPTPAWAIGAPRTWADLTKEIGTVHHSDPPADNQPMAAERDAVAAELADTPTVGSSHTTPPERAIRHAGRGMYHVYSGDERITERPLPKDEAEKML